MKSTPVLSFTLTVLRPFRWSLAAQLLVAVIWAAHLSIYPYLIKIILNRIPGISSDQIFSRLLPPAILLLITSITLETAFRFYDWVLIKFTPNLKKHIGMTLINHLMGHSYKLYQNNFAGSLANKVNDVIGNIPDLTRIFIDRFCSHAFGMLIAIYTVCFASIKFGISLICLIIIFLTISITFAPTSRKLSDKAASTLTSTIGKIVDVITNMMSVRLFSARKFEHRYLENSFNTVITSEQKRDKLFLKIRIMEGSCLILFQAICLWWLISGLKAGTITPGDFALILFINGSLSDALWNLSTDIRRFVDHLGKVAQGLRIVTSAHDITDVSDAKPLLVSRGEIIFDRVHFNYEGSDNLFSNKSLTILAGQKVGLVGYSGSGKSTFVNLIMRLFDIASGRILIDSQDISHVTQESLRQAIATIPQDPSLFHRTLMENIRYGKIDATDDEVIEAAKHANADEFIITLKQGYQSLVGERGVKLSGGQRQRIAIARAILKNAPILILDEATSQLDSVTEANIQKSLWQLMQNKTTLVIAHRLSTLLRMDRILVFHQGKIVEDGTHEQLLALNGLYKKLWDAQVGGFLPRH